jgi:hypothetical protein
MYQAQSLDFQTLNSCSTDKDIYYKMVPKWRFDVDVSRSADPKKWVK